MAKRRLPTLALAAASALTIIANDFQGAVDRFVNQNIFRNASVGVCVLRLDSGTVVAANAPHQSLITASTMKTVTSASALELLGTDFTFVTEVKAIGKIDDNHLKGDLVVVGHGDPTLGSRHFAKMPNFVDSVVRAVKSLGIERIDGNIIFDESAYPFETFSDLWMAEDLAYDYGPGVHAINFADNLVRLSFDRSGDVAREFVFTPAVRNLEVVCHATIGDKQDMHRLLNIGPNPNILLYGSIKRSDKRYISDFVNPLPAQLLCDSIDAALHNADIRVRHKHHHHYDADTVLVMQYHSPQLKDIVESLLDRSDNMFTEAVLRALAVHNGKEASAANGIAVIDSLWRTKGLDTKPLFQRDGSGLARNGRASAHFFTQMLRQVNADSTAIGVAMPSLMTHLGVTGNIGQRIKKSPLKGKIASKSGSMSDVQCYVGYFPAENPQYSWAILVNNWHGSRAYLKDEIELLLLNLFSGLDTQSSPSE
ncbi:MAG: D-alanyl-D-alanine carboxypeptidase/D-alanyl-D-alanine-endopeptidase [Muribaculaceae bacterium]